jgi:hypothetical protein
MRNNTTKLIAALALAGLSLIACARPSSAMRPADEPTTAKQVTYMCTVDEDKASGTVPCPNPGGGQPGWG